MVLASGGLLVDGGFGDDRSGSLAGPMGLLVILVLAVGTIFLLRNMSGRLRRLPSTFGAPGDEAPTGTKPTTATAPTAPTASGTTTSATAAPANTTGNDQLSNGDDSS